MESVPDVEISSAFARNASSHEVHSTLTVIGAEWCSDCRRTKAFLAEHDVAYEWIDVDVNPEANALVEKLNAGNRTIPTVIFPDGTHFAEPADHDLAIKLGL